jgi:hypothetical protein
VRALEDLVEQVQQLRASVEGCQHEVHLPRGGLQSASVWRSFACGTLQVKLLKQRVAAHEEILGPNLTDARRQRMSPCLPGIFLRHLTRDPE